MKNNITQIIDKDKLFSSVLDNPQDIINIQTSSKIQKIIHSAKCPDAIYIPFLNRHLDLDELVNSLSWYKNAIFILVSENTPLDLLTRRPNTFILDYYNNPITKKIKNLKTFTNSYDAPAIKYWDLPVKRNFAIWHSIQNNFNKILLLDDDIYGINEALIYNNIEALDSNNISGSLVKEFPDTSVIGHIEQKYGDPYNPFISGNFLFIKPKETVGYFPLIYNEDWLFMIPSILEKKVTAIDLIYQKQYDPYDDIKRIALQEFGEIIGEGLFELISQKKWDERLSGDYWHRYISYRIDYVTQLQNNGENKIELLLKESLEIASRIKPMNCINFILNWEEDIISFEKIKRNEE